MDWKEIHQEMDKVNHAYLRLTLTYSGSPRRALVLALSFIRTGAQVCAELPAMKPSAALEVCRLQGKHCIGPTASLLNIVMER